MKLTLILTLLVFVTFGNSFSQVKLSLQLKKATIQEVIETIEDQTDYIFLYKDEIFDLNQKYSLDFEKTSFEEVLKSICEAANVDYEIRNDRQIILKEKIKEKLIIIQQDKKNITGVVTDTDGLPLPGVSVIVKGTTTGTVTDIEGKFNLEIPLTVKTLQFSFVGMKTQDVAIAGKTTVIITMEEVAIGIEEVVAIGYGSQKKANLTGAVGIATAERLENRPIVNVGQGLQGVIPNLNISIRNGDPNTSADFNIRGYESINGGSPLILVDGVPMDLERINPNDIASVNVLKDAAAAAVYGARAAFGVILVETKKGTKGKVRVTFSTEQSISKPIYLMDAVTDPYEYAVAVNGAYERSNGVPRYGDWYLEGAKKYSENPTEENAWAVENESLQYYGNNDYANQLITDFAPQDKYDMTISGSSEAASYYVSFGYLKKDGYLKNNEKNRHYQRYNILMKADFKINDWLSLDEKIVFNSQVNENPHFYTWDTNINSSAMIAPFYPLAFPDLPYYLEPGDRDQFEQYIGMGFQNNNFIPYLENGGRSMQITNDTWYTQGITLTPIKGLMVRGDFSYRSYWSAFQDVASKIEVINGMGLAPVQIFNGVSGNDYIMNQDNHNQYYVFNTYAEYTLDKFTGHYIKAMVGFNQEWNRNQYVGAKAATLLVPTIADISATTGVQQAFGSKSHTSLRGAFYRFNYIYKDKYLVEANGRYDGTSRFPKDSRFGFFPSVSAGWRISNENFMGSTRVWLDNLKIRASYGTLGNQLLGSNYYPYIATMGAGSSSYIMSSGVNPYVSAAGLVSPSLTWETVTTKNIGLDITMLNQKLDISADIYTRDTKGMLMGVSYPAILGTSAPSSNAADLRTQGWELSVTWRDKIGQDWSYGLNLALSDNQTEITKYENPTNSISGYRVGKKIGEIWGYTTEGIFQTDEEVAAHANQSRLGANWRAGDIKYLDINEDGILSGGNGTMDDPGDYSVIGNTSPRYTFGINPDVSYKNLTLNIFFQGLFRDYLPDYNQWQAFYPFNSTVVEKYYLTETWSPDNRDAYFAAPSEATLDKKNIQPQSRYVQDAAYIRLKNLTLNYNFPQHLVSKVGLSRASVYFAGMNLWEYTKMHKPLDPESVYTTTQEYYIQRTFTVGVKVTF